MSERRPLVDDRMMQNVIGQLLRAGVLLAAAIVLAGAVVYLARHGAEAPNYHAFRGEPVGLRSIVEIWNGALALHGDALIALGLLVLIATPVARVALAGIAFALEGDRLYTVVALVVLTVLLLSLTGRI